MFFRFIAATSFFVFVATASARCTREDLHSQLQISPIDVAQLEDGVTIYVRHGGAIVAEADVYLKETTLRFDIEVTNTSYRRRGIYSMLLSKVVEQVPQVTEIPVDLQWDDSDSALFWVTSVFGKYVNQGYALQRINQVMNGADSSKRKLWYQKMVQAIFEMPVWKARAAVGFSRLEHLTFNFLDGSIFVRFKKGEFNPDELKVYLLHGRVDLFERSSRLLPDGTIKVVSMVEALSLGNFDYIIPMGEREP